MSQKNQIMDQVLAAKDARIKELEAALRDAKDDVEFWAQYANPYIRDKFDIQGDFNRMTAVLARSTD